MSMEKKIVISNSPVGNDDVMFEIFLRIHWRSWKLIFRCRSISKQWFSVLSNPIFISAWMKANNYIPWTTIIHDSTLPFDDDHVTIASPNVYSEFVTGTFSLNFVCSDELYILGASSNNGLVLCSTTKHRHTEYYVCNPLLKMSVLLPKPLDTKGIVFSGLISASSSETGYQVIRIPQFGVKKKEFSIEIYSSGLGKWSCYEVLCDKAVTMPKLLQTRCSMIGLDGVLYWSEGEGHRIIALDICNRQCKVIELPEEIQQGGEKCLAEFNGSIACIHGHKNQLSVWVLQNDDTWIRGFHYTRPLNHRDCTFRPLAYNPTTQSVVTLESYVRTKTYYVCKYSMSSKRTQLDRVYNNPNRAPEFIKAFVLALLPTPLCN